MPDQESRVSGAALPTGALSLAGSHPAASAPPSARQLAVLSLPLAYLWFRLLHNLWPEWTTNPQNGYGLLVPLLCVGLLLRRLAAANGVDGKRIADNGQRECGNRAATLQVGAFAALSFLYLPTRLIEAATPEWRPIQWALGIEAVGLTVCAIYLSRGRGWLRQVLFPICFIFVAIPWPSLVETPVIQSLTRLSAGIVIELLGWLGVPAVGHGNVIEVSTGLVGIDEACSGIRSFQSSLMISIFLGEFYRLKQPGRWFLIAMGLVFSLAFNVCRMLLLTFVAAKRGVAAIDSSMILRGLASRCYARCLFGAWLCFSAASPGGGRPQSSATGPVPARGRGSPIAGQAWRLRGCNSRRSAVSDFASCCGWGWLRAASKCGIAPANRG